MFGTDNSDLTEKHSARVFPKSFNVLRFAPNLNDFVKSHMLCTIYLKMINSNEIQFPFFLSHCFLVFNITLCVQNTKPKKHNDKIKKEYKFTYEDYINYLKKNKTTNIGNASIVVGLSKKDDLYNIISKQYMIKETEYNTWFI